MTWGVKEHMRKDKNDEWNVWNYTQYERYERSRQWEINEKAYWKPYVYMWMYERNHKESNPIGVQGH